MPAAAAHPMPIRRLRWASPRWMAWAQVEVGTQSGEFIGLDYLPTRIALVAALVRRIGE